MNRLLITVAVALAGFRGITPAAELRPKLVVGIVVDQLRTDYLENLKDMMTSGGFRRLMENGAYLKDIDYKIVPADAATSTAIIQTGAYPRQNGIASSRIYDANTNTAQSVFTDPAFIGNFTSETYSPGALRVTTLTDALSLETSGKSNIHSIAPDAESALVLAGHTGNSAFWINDETGRWATTTYYTGAPAVLQNRNYQSPLVSRLDTMKWTPLRKGEPYPLVSAEEVRNGFRYSFSRSDKDVFALYKKSPYINNDITTAATEYLTLLNTGKADDVTNVLNLSYTLAPYPSINNPESKYEIEDAYLRLDKDLETLFTAIDKTVGRDNSLIYLVSTGYYEDPLPDASSYRLPGGNFSVKRAISLLNAYLSAKYGNGAYVERYGNRQIYLSKKLLEEKNLDLNKIAEESRDFLLKMSGVADAYTSADISKASTPRIEEIRFATDPKSAGDILLEFNPGWMVTDDSRYPTKVETEKSTSYLTPAFLMGKGVKPQIVNSSVEATAIAPTVASLLHIRSPNSSVSKPLTLTGN